jgi:hypothetical protein
LCGNPTIPLFKCFPENRSHAKQLPLAFADRKSPRSMP